MQPTHAALYEPDPLLPLPFPGCPAFLVIMQALQQFVAAPKKAAGAGKRDRKLAMEVATAERLLAVMEASVLAATDGEPN